MLAPRSRDVRALPIAALLLVALAAPPAGGQLRTRLTAAIAAPAGVTATYTGTGVRIDWQGVTGAVQYLVLRGPDATTPGTQIGAVPATDLTYTDAGFNAQAGYQVVAVAADGRRAASAIVAYQPTLTTIAATQPIATIAPTRTVTSTTLTRLAPSTTAPEPAVVRRIAGVGKTMVRAGQSIPVSGLGLMEVTGAYFGSGAPGSPTNPKIPVANATDSGLEIRTPAGCNQSGPLTLELPTSPATYVTPDTAITLHCFAATPSGTIHNLNAQGVFNLTNMGQVTITGTGLRAVTHAVDNLGRRHPVTYQNAGGADQLVLSLGPWFTHGLTLRFGLENVLTNPVEVGKVAGAVFTVTPPLIDSIAPLWAEPGQKIRLVGHGLNAGGTPQVLVGGVSAQLLWTSPTVIEARVGLNARSDSIVITNPSGRTVLSESFHRTDDSLHPAFFLVRDGSAITHIDAHPYQAIGDTIEVQGVNLARLMGMCVTRKTGLQQNTTAILYRIDQQMGYATSNTTMRVVLGDPIADLRGGSIQVFRPTQPVGDHPPSQFACGYGGHVRVQALTQWP
jgi:hypothetical protein